MQNWNSNIYLKFREERGQPSLDLINRLKCDYKTILDLGCGPGNSTSNLKNKFSNSEISGIDADDNMLEKAKKEHPELDFKKALLPADLDLFGKFDLIFSNACIHWIPEQSLLISKVSEHLNKKGTFAVQIPLTSESQFYSKILREVSGLKEYAHLSSIKNFHSLDEYGYYRELSKYFSEIQIWRTDYHHIVDSSEDIISWYEGSGLKPYLDKLSETEKKSFKHELKIRIEKNYKQLSDGKYFLIMPRLFFIAK